MRSKETLRWRKGVQMPFIDHKEINQRKEKEMRVIDRKFRFIAVNPANGKIYTEKAAMVFVAKDAALLPTLRAYYHECKLLGCDENHMESIRLLLGRVVSFQGEHGSQTADTVVGVETDRCIEGILKEEEEK